MTFFYSEQSFNVPAKFFRFSAENKTFRKLKREREKHHDLLHKKIWEKKKIRRFLIFSTGCFDFPILQTRYYNLIVGIIIIIM